jgi:hypothetical protein
MKPLRQWGRLTFAALAAGLLVGCATFRVGSFVERGIRFGPYETFDWAPADRMATGDPRLDNNEFFQAQVQQAIQRELAARGIDRREVASPDLVVHYHASITQEVDANGADEKYGYCEDCRPSVFEAGTLTIDFVDARTNRLVWRGWAEGSLDGAINNQKALEQRVNDAVAEIIARFPATRGLV